MFNIDDDPDAPVIKPKSWGVDANQGIDYTYRMEAAERTHRQIIENIELHETAAELTEYWQSESVIIDAMNLSCPHYADAIDAAYKDQLAIINGAAIHTDDDDWANARSVKK